MDKNYFKFNCAEQRILVLPDETSETKTPSGIIIPETAKEGKVHTGRIICVGKGSQDNPMNYSRNQIVVYSEYAGSSLTLDLVEGEETFKHTEFKVMNQTDVWGTLTEML